MLLNRTHQVSGNPVRFRSGAVPIALDDAWTTQMGGFNRRLAGAITTPLRRRYGYHGARPDRTER